MLNSSTQLVRGESILIHGAAGGVGSIAVQLAKAMGASPVIGSASSEEKRSFILSLVRTPPSTIAHRIGLARCSHLRTAKERTSFSNQLGARSLNRTLPALPHSVVISSLDQLAAQVSLCHPDN